MSDFRVSLRQKIELYMLFFKEEDLSYLTKIVRSESGNRNTGKIRVRNNKTKVKLIC